MQIGEGEPQSSPPPAHDPSKEGQLQSSNTAACTHSGGGGRGAGATQPQCSAAASRFLQRRKVSRQPQLRAERGNYVSLHGISILYLPPTFPIQLVLCLGGEEGVLHFLKSCLCPVGKLNSSNKGLQHSPGRPPPPRACSTVQGLMARQEVSCPSIFHPWGVHLWGYK